jgi:hypothetical protein
MGNVFGSCIGSFSGTCAVACLSRGDFSESSNWFTNTLDTILTILPMIVMVVSSVLHHPVVPSFTSFYLTGTLVTHLCLFGIREPRKMYGARFLVPIGIGFFGFWISFPESPKWLFVTSTISSASISTVCLSDLGFRLNQQVRQSFDSVYATYWLLISYQVVLAIVSGTIIFLAINALNDWLYFVIAPIITVLAVWDYETPSNSQRGSIMSVAIFFAGIVLVLQSTIPFPIVIVLLSVYNNFVLHDSFYMASRDQNETLLTPKESHPPSNDNLSRHSFNSLLCLAQYVSGPVTWASSPLIFLVTSLSLYVWIIVAPVVLTSRTF